MVSDLTECLPVSPLGRLRWWSIQRRRDHPFFVPTVKSPPMPTFGYGEVFVRLAVSAVPLAFGGSSAFWGRFFQCKVEVNPQKYKGAQAHRCANVFTSILRHIHRPVREHTSDQRLFARPRPAIPFSDRADRARQPPRKSGGTV